jgi:High potential iron-sulfur protein
MKQPARPRFTRRALIETVGRAAPVVILPWRLLAAEALPKLAVNDPAAAALGYVEAAAGADRKKYPDYSPSSSCENCAQLQGTAGAAYRPCGLFPGKLVAAAGWCSGWVPEI